MFGPRPYRFLVLAIAASLSVQGMALGSDFCDEEMISFYQAMTSPLDALRRLEAAPGEFELVITDQTMPRLTGADLATKVRQFAPELPFVMVSGYLDPELVLPPNVYTSLQKPVPVEVLLRVVDEARCRK